MAVPKIIPYDVELRSVNPVRSFDRPKAYTNDLKSVEFQFKILDMTSTDLETATAITLVYMRDGSFFANPSTDVERVGNVFSYLLKENEGNHAGVAQIQLVVTIDDAEFASQLFDFEIINGLETKVAQEVMIYDWTTLTRDARDYIDQFVADEVFRDAQFENAQFDRNVAFVGSQDARTLAFGTEQTNRGTAFTAEQNERTTAFNESESGRTTAETGRVTAESNRVTAESGRVTKEGQRVTAENNRVTAESGRVTAESGRVTAESARVTAETNRAAAFTAFDTRLTAEETATANNKISAVKGKTFADVDARLEDVEFDTTLMATNLAVNGDFSNGVSSWSTFAGTTVAGEYKFDTGVADFLYQIIVAQSPSKFYFAMKVYGGGSIYVRMYNLSANQLISDTATVVSPSNGKSIRSGVLTATGEGTQLRINRVQDTGLVYIDDVILINLTATFGKGNEPTAEQMDGILAKFPNSWLDGTKNLFRANATLNKLMAVDARTEFEAKNEVANGDFSNGNTGWSSGAITNTLSVVDGALRTTAGEKPYVGQVLQTKIPANAKLYILFKARANRAATANIGLSTNTAFGVISQNSNIALTTSFTSYSLILTPTSDIVGVRINGVDYTTAGDYIDIDNFVVINLTATFGAGKEPTLAEMDRLMARFPNSWFDGVKPIQTIETLYQEKANKVQEAWIAPTLVNSWTEMAAIYPVRYRKDSLGKVTLKGRITGGVSGTTVFTLPVGYRPPYTMSLSCATALNTTIRVLVYDTGAVNISGTLSGDPYLDGITFDTN